MRFRGGGIGHKDSREASDFFLNDRDDMDIERRANPTYEPPEDARDIAEFEASFSRNFPEEAAAAAVPWEEQVDENPDEDLSGASDDEIWEKENGEGEGEGEGEGVWEDELVEALGPEDGEDEEDDFGADGMAPY